MSGFACIIVDAFTERAFAGNPAAVCLLDDAADAAWMQALAAEMNLSETAFVFPLEGGFSLRWFTPTVEVELCGHATLASAHVLWSLECVDAADAIRFHTQSGVLTCTLDDEWIELDLPATPAKSAEPLPGMLDALRIEASYVGLADNGNYLVVVDEQALRELTPDFAALRDTSVLGVIVTSSSSDARYDFLSRYFAPNAGIDEDPVTGAAHCCLGPYWATQLGKPRLCGYQASKRGGVVQVRVDDERVILRGQAVTVLCGTLSAEASSHE